MDDRGIAREPGALRCAARILLQHGRERGLAAFRVADTHVHALLVGDRVEAGRFALFAEAGMRKRLRLPARFDRCRIRPIEGERHLSSALRYVFTQEAHHGTAFDLAHDGSSLPDLLGMRMDAAWIATRVRRELPRLTRETLLEWLGFPDLDTRPVDLGLVADGAAAAFGVTSLDGVTIDHRRARRAAVHFVDRVAGTARTAGTLGLAPRSVTRYRAESVTSAELRAVSLQAKLRTAIRYGGIEASK